MYGTVVLMNVNCFGLFLARQCVDNITVYVSECVDRESLIAQIKLVVICEVVWW